MSIKPLAMRDAFLERIWKTMVTNDQIFFVSADFGSPVLDKIRADFPKRFVNVGIAEQNLINITAGLALEGYTLFTYAIAPFITMRCFEQIRVSLALLSEVRPMNVSLIGVGAGYSYVVSGPTHQCYEDITLMRALPNFRVLSPADHLTSAGLFDVCLNTKGLKYLRLDAQVLPVIYDKKSPDFHLGFSEHRQGNNVCMLATGYMLHTALKIADELEALGIKVGVVDLFDITHFNEFQLIKQIESYRGIVSLEEGFAGRGGLDAKVFEIVLRNNLPQKIMNIGVEGGYSFELGTRTDLHEIAGIGPTICLQKIKNFIGMLNK
jgi:transketolase